MVLNALLLRCRYDAKIAEYFRWARINIVSHLFVRLTLVSEFAVVICLLVCN